MIERVAQVHPRTTLIKDPVELKLSKKPHGLWLNKHFANSMLTFRSASCCQPFLYLFWLRPVIDYKLRTIAALPEYNLFVFSVNSLHMPSALQREPAEVGLCRMAWDEM